MEFHVHKFLIFLYKAYGYNVLGNGINRFIWSKS